MDCRAQYSRFRLVIERDNGNLPRIYEEIENCKKSFFCAEGIRIRILCLSVRSDLVTAIEPKALRIGQPKQLVTEPSCH